MKGDRKSRGEDREKFFFSISSGASALWCEEGTSLTTTTASMQHVKKKELSV